MEINTVNLNKFMEIERWFDDDKIEIYEVEENGKLKWKYQIFEIWTKLCWSRKWLKTIKYRKNFTLS